MTATRIPTATLIPTATQALTVAQVQAAAQAHEMIVKNQILKKKINKDIKNRLSEINDSLFFMYK